MLLASPITLIALLTTVAHTWRQEALAENYREVARLGNEFYERLAMFAGHFDDVRKRLDGAVQAYNQAAGSFESRVLVSASRLKDLEVTTAAELPAAEPIDPVPRVLRQIGLMGLPERRRPTRRSRSREVSLALEFIDGHCCKYNLKFPRCRIPLPRSPPRARSTSSARSSRTI